MERGHRSHSQSLLLKTAPLPPARMIKNDQTEQYCLPSEECGECTDTDPIMSRHARPIKESVNVSSFRSRKVTSEQNTVGPDGTDRRSQLLHWPQKSPGNRFCLKVLELNNNTVQVIRDKEIQHVIALKSSTGGRKRHHATRLLAANLGIGTCVLLPLCCSAVIWAQLCSSPNLSVLIPNSFAYPLGSVL